MDAGKASCTESLPRTIWWEDDGDGRGRACLIDQTKLPSLEVVMSCTGHVEMIDAIKTLAVRGAPALGVSGAFAIALWACNESGDRDVESFMSSLGPVSYQVASARPTAVNLSWGVRKMVELAESSAVELAGAGASGLAELKQRLVSYACALADEDERTNRLIGEHGSGLFAPGSRIMTHCNAGSLATVFFGTALGVIFSAYDKGLVEHVYTCETRPVNQGGRLTAYELVKAGIPATLICDNMAATVMSKGMVNAVVVGADRIAANGDTANKIGTMGHAVLANHFGIPFYIAAPFSTIDMTLETGAGIVIEERDSREVRGFSGSGTITPLNEESDKALSALAGCAGGYELGAGSSFLVSRDAEEGGYSFNAWIRSTPEGIGVFNPAFDVTPAGLIAGIITEKGVYRPGADGSFDFTRLPEA